MTDRLSMERMMAAATRETGRARFSDLEFVPALTKLVDSLNNEARLNALGVQLQKDRLTDLLKTRLRLEAWIEKRPDIEEEELAPPVVILSLPRTGTTMLQRLMSTDRRFQPIHWYEVRFPIPDLDWDFSEATDARIPAAKAEVAALIEANPNLLSIHPLDAMAADEDLLLLETTFSSNVPPSQADIPSYNAYYENDDALAATRYHRKLLQFLQWQRRQTGEKVDGRPWLLKSPAHMFTIDAMQQVYPGARFITSHRDPLACIPSISSFYYNQWVVYSDDVDPTRCGQAASHFFAASLERAHAASVANPDRFLGFEYEDLIRHQDDVLARIYDFLGLPFTDEARRGIEQHRAENPRDKRKPHDYTLEQFGFTRQSLREAFGKYCERRGYVG